MGFQTPLYELSDYLKWTTTGRIQLPDFQRGYKWDDERIRSLLVTILRGHPLGVVMLLKTGNTQIRFKPRPIEGVNLDGDVDAELLLLDGQQRLTSLTQALTGSGVVATKDSRGKLMNRRYYVRIQTALLGEDHLEEAVISVPGDGVVRSNFGRDIELDLSTSEKEQAEGYFPVRLLFAAADTMSWMFAFGDNEVAGRFHEQVVRPASTYNIPAIELDKDTSKAAVATVFEKVNTGGLTLSVFELLTASFAGDAAYYARTGTDFRLNDDWQETLERFSSHSVLKGVENTDFLQAVTMLASRKRALAAGSTSGGITARREDVLKLELDEYLEWRDPLRDAFIWASTYLADRHIFDARSVPYDKQLVPLAALRVVLGGDIDLHGNRDRLNQWFWCGVLGELYSGSVETQFARDLEQAPDWIRGAEEAATPRTVSDANFVESRLHSLRTRNAAAYKGIHALVLGQGARDWMYDQELGKVQYAELAVDIHHVFPQKWCNDNEIDAERRESIVNKTPLSAATNRCIGGAAPSSYLGVVERRARIEGVRVDQLLSTHLVDPAALRTDDFDTYFANRRAALLALVESAMGKAAQRDLEQGAPQEDVTQFDATDLAVLQDDDELYDFGESIYGGD
jgi:hypothetical protein